MCVWWMPEAGICRLCEPSVVAQTYYDTLQGISNELRGSEKHTFVSRKVTLFSAVLYLSPFSVDSHKIKEELQSNDFQALVIRVCCLLFAFSHFRTRYTSLQICHLFLNSSCPISHLCSAFFRIWLVVPKYINASYKTKYPEDFHSNVTIWSQWGEMVNSSSSLYSC